MMQFFACCFVFFGAITFIASGWNDRQLVSVQRDTIEHLKSAIDAHNRAFEFQQRTIHTQQETIDMLEAYMDAEEGALESNSPRLN